MALRPRFIVKLIWPAFQAIGPGVLLIFATVLAIILANSELSALYFAAIHDPLSATPIAELPTLDAWINDAAMAVFFLLVGLEIKREALVGALAGAQERRLPVIAALAGMAVPALVFLAIAHGHPELWRGWAIPAATDIAFAMAVIAVLGRRVPRSLRLFLLAVAIVDDIGAVLVIALFYATAIDLGWLTAAAAVLAAMVTCNRLRVRHAWPYLLLALPLWYCTLRSGLHPTIAGVAAALCVPLRGNRGHHGPLRRVEHALDGPVNYIVMPLFALANAGVALAGAQGSSAATTLALAVAAALVLGKQAGVGLAVFGSEVLGIARRPAGTNALHVWGAALACGVGFTMSLFIAALAFPRAADLQQGAKIGILAGSGAAALAAMAVLLLAHRRSRRTLE